MSLQEARNALHKLIEAANQGAIIPVRLPGQLEAIQVLLEQTEAAQAQNSSQQTTLSGDAEAVMHENAEFMKTAIHELRTPMTSIRGYADMLANPSMVGELSAMQNQLLQVIRTNARRMESLLSDMSYMNKLRAGILKVNAKMDMFKNIAMMVEKAMRPVAAELNRQLEFDIPQGLPYLNTDGELLSHAIDKLVENGLRYSAEGTGNVIVSGKGEGNDLVITIADNGIGMIPDEIAMLGTLYYRADHDAVRAHKGSGLGIPIAYGLVKLLGGTVRVDSTPGKGTQFILRFKGMS